MGQAACDQLKADKARLEEEVVRLKTLLTMANVVPCSAEIEIGQAADTVAGKPYLLKSLFGIHGSKVLTQLSHCAELFSNLPMNAARASQYYEGLNDPEQEALGAFRAQFQDSSRTLVVPDKLK